MSIPSDGAAAPGLAAPEAADFPSPPVALAPRRAARAVAIRRQIKRLIVLAGCWGFPPAWAHWLIERGGLKHE